MRNISFALTTEQVRNQTKTVTRRTGWKSLQPGTLLQPVVKGMGLKKGERVEKIGGPIRVVDVRRESLSRICTANYGSEELVKEGGCWANADAFLQLFPGDPDQVVTRIEFEYVDAERIRKGADRG